MQARAGTTPPGTAGTAWRDTGRHGKQGVSGVAEGPRGSSERGGVRLADLRGHNTALVLDLVRGAGLAGISRPELASRTGLTVQAVSKITGRLRDGGLLTEAGRQESTGGKPATALRLVRGAVRALGVHLDRGGVLVVRTDLTGRTLARRRATLDLGRGPDEVVDVVARAMAELAGGGTDGAPLLLGAGLAAPGPLDHRTGVLHK
ncbi:ROK family transcriptional regulator, partial [Streptomyces sp. SPB074]